MNSKIVFLFALVVAVAAAKDIRKVRDVSENRWYAKGTQIAYDCTGKSDGNYPHPTLCTHYVACVAETHAYEMVCATDLDGTPLHYVQDSGPNEQTSHCDYPEVAGCAGPEPAPETTQAPPAPAPETTQAPVEPEPEPETCNPDECVLEGDCQGYRQCVASGKGDGKGTWVNRECSAEKDLFWNPDVNAQTGGVCDYFANLSAELQKKYTDDADCIAPCAWFQEESDACSPNYTYRTPFDGKTNSGRESRLSCPSSPSADDAALFWNQDTLTCDKSSNVKGCQS